MPELPAFAQKALRSMAREDRNLAGVALPTNYEKLTQRGRAIVRQAYVEQQDGLCYYCKHRLDQDPPAHIKRLPINWSHFPPNFTQHRIHLHHCHATGLTLGATHALCNAVLAEYHGE